MYKGSCGTRSCLILIAVASLPLDPDTTYYIRAGEGAQMSSERKIRTGPVDGHQLCSSPSPDISGADFHFVGGGDMGWAADSPVEDLLRESTRNGNSSCC